MKKLAELLIEHRGNQTSLAQYLGMTRNTLRKIITEKQDLFVMDGSIYRKYGEVCERNKKDKDNE